MNYPVLSSLLHKHRWLSGGWLILIILLLSWGSTEAKTIAWGRFYGAPRFSHAQQSLQLKWPPLLSLNEVLTANHPPQAKKERFKTVTVAISFSASATPQTLSSKPQIFKGLLTENLDTHAVSIVLR
ncbi:MAG: hypothetical protein QE263_03715 [Vampirovibrionales bacterium]|nr:hypothetical protein [Vampirovibrionales bacterium]